MEKTVCGRIESTTKDALALALPQCKMEMAELMASGRDAVDYLRFEETALYRDVWDKFRSAYTDIQRGLTRQEWQEKWGEFAKEQQQRLRTLKQTNPVDLPAVQAALAAFNSVKKERSAPPRYGFSMSSGSGRLRA